MKKEKAISDKTAGKIAILMDQIFAGVLSGNLDPEAILRCLNETLTYSVPVFQYDMRKKGWKLVADSININYPIPCLEIIEIPPGGHTLRKCLDEITGQYTVLSQHQAEYLLANSALIPEPWEKKKIFFTGTVWSNELNELRIPFMQLVHKKRIGDHWEIDFRKLDREHIGSNETYDCVVLRLVENP